MNVCANCKKECDVLWGRDLHNTSYEIYYALSECCADVIYVVDNSWVFESEEELSAHPQIEEERVDY